MSAKQKKDNNKDKDKEINHIKIIEKTNQTKDKSNQNQNQNQNQNSVQTSTKQEDKHLQYSTPIANRLGALIYHPYLAQEHKQIIQRKFAKVNRIRDSIAFMGVGVIMYHLYKNKFMLSKTTPIFIIVPPFLSYIVKYLGFYWVESSVDNLGLFKEYKIMFK